MKRVLIIIGITAGLLLLVPVIPYISMYGSDLIYSHEKWGQFGDFFGGIMNPIYALLAFLALLYTISQQALEMRQATNEFRRSADTMQKQIDHLSLASRKEDLFKIIKDIDDELGEIHSIIVSAEGKQPVLNLSHITHEGFRLRNTSVKSGAYLDFIRLANDSGSLVEATYLRLALAMGGLYKHLKLYSELSGTEASYVTEYFKNKYFMVAYLLNDAGSVDQEIIQYFQSGVKFAAQQENLA
jgi:hypothetical protein